MSVPGISLPTKIYHYIRTCLKTTQSCYKQEIIKDIVQELVHMCLVIVNESNLHVACSNAEPKTIHSPDLVQEEVPVEQITVLLSYIESFKTKEALVRNIMMDKMGTTDTNRNSVSA